MTSPPGTTSPAVAQKLSTNAINAAFTPEPFVSLDEESAGLEELADLDQGSIQDIPIQGFAVTQAWAAKYPKHPRGVHPGTGPGQQIADTDRAAVELAVEKYLQIPSATAAFLSLPSFPTGVDMVRLQRVVSAMSGSACFRGKDASFKIQSMTGG